MIIKQKSMEINNNATTNIINNNSSYEDIYGLDIGIVICTKER